LFEVSELAFDRAASDLSRGDGGAAIADIAVE
jgi:hypothetical protein